MPDETDTNRTPSLDEAPLVLAVDDDPQQLALILDLLQNAGMRTTSAEDGPTGIAIAEKYRPNAILLDIAMPGLNGYQVCEELKDRASTEEIPVIFITGQEPTDETIERCFGVGANDFLTKPIRRVELLARLRVALREHALRESYRRLAMHDTLTGLSNRRQFIKDLDNAIDMAKRQGTTATVFISDIDQFRDVKQRLGHDFCDELVLTLSRLIKRFTSPDCKAGRIADGVLAGVLTNTTRERTIEFCNRLRQTFAAVAFDAQSNPKHFTAGFGVASYHGEPANMNVDDFLGQADIALARAKQLGRNRTIAYWDLTPEEIPPLSSYKRHSRATPRSPSTHAYICVDGEQTVPNE